MINNSELSFDNKNYCGITKDMRHNTAMNQRIIYIYDDIDDSSISESIYYLNKIKYMDEKYQNGKRPIELQISTDGGNVTDGLSLIALIESMKQSGYEITTTCVGKAYSMGFLLSICGSIRKAYKYSKYMYHDVSYGIYGKHADVMEYIDYIKMLQSDALDIVTRYTNQPRSFFEDINNRKCNKFFTLDDMIKMNGVDYIV